MKVSLTRAFIEYILIALSVYLLLSGAIAIIGGYNYREILCSHMQVVALLSIYWWVPLFRMRDLSLND